MNLAEFDYQLPDGFIAQVPLADRAASRMLVVYREQGRWEDRLFRELPEFLRAGDCLVLTDSKVFPSRHYGCRQGVHSLPVGKNNPKKWQNLSGRVEVFLLRPVSDDGLRWEALVRPGRNSLHVAVANTLSNYFAQFSELSGKDLAQGGDLPEHRVSGLLGPVGVQVWG